MRIVIAPDKFKGSLTALDAARAIARGFSKSFPGAELLQMPIADGGEGTAEAIQAVFGGEWITVAASDPLGRPIEARYARLPDGTAVIDMCEASGLWRLQPAEYDPLRANTYGTGQLIHHALRHGALKIFLGLGGSATNDGGIGMAEALGFQFVGADGRPLPAIPANLPSIVRIQPPASPIQAEVVALSDVQNPLTGERGASRVYGPQKGASPELVETLDAHLRRLADLVAHDLGADFRDTPGSGAAGGLGFGLLSFCRAKIQPGFDTIAGLMQLESRIAESDLVITGEGRLDAQTLEGKGPAGVARQARLHCKPVIAFAGSIAANAGLERLFDQTHAITPEGMPLSEALLNAPILMENAAARVAQRTAEGKGHLPA